MLHLPSQETVHRDQNESDEERDDIVNKKKGGNAYEKDITDQNGRSNDVACTNQANVNYCPQDDKIEDLEGEVCTAG